MAYSDSFGVFEQSRHKQSLNSYGVRPPQLSVMELSSVLNRGSLIPRTTRPASLVLEIVYYIRKHKDQITSQNKHRCHLNAHEADTTGKYSAACGCEEELRKNSHNHIVVNPSSFALR